MGRVAKTTILPKTRLDELRKAAVPAKPWFFGKPIDRYASFLAEAGKPLPDYDWTGDYLIETIKYLRTLDIDLLASDYNDLAKFLDETRGGTHFVMTWRHQVAHLERLQTMSYVEDNLRHYYERQRKVEDFSAGRTMKDALQYVCNILEAIDEKTIAILGVE